MSIGDGTIGDDVVPGKKQVARTAALSAYIETRLKEIGTSASGASTAAGLERTAIRDIYRGSVPGAHKLSALAAVLRVQPDRLLQLIDATPQDPAHPIGSGLQTLLDGNGAVTFDRRSHDLPLLRQESRVDGLPSDVPVATIARPPALQGRASAYGIYIADDLNAPLLLPGHVAYVDPSRPPQIGRPVRAFFHDQAPLIALLAAQNGSEIQLQLVAEAAPRTYPASAVAQLHRIVGFSLVDD